MNLPRVIAVLLILAGGFVLAYGGFTYTKDSHEANVGPLHLELKEKEHVNVPMWVGAGVLLVGVLLLAIPRKQ